MPFIPLAVRRMLRRAKWGIQSRVDLMKVFYSKHFSPEQGKGVSFHTNVVMSVFVLGVVWLSYFREDYIDFRVFQFLSEEQRAGLALPGAKFFQKEN